MKEKAQLVQRPWGGSVWVSEEGASGARAQ